MTLRDLAARDRIAMIGPGAHSIGEPIIYISGGIERTIAGAWREVPSETVITHGVGVESSFSSATLSLAMSAAPALTRADRFRRVATSQTWKIEQVETIADVGYRIHLSRVTDATLRGAK